ncbi:MAG: Flp pilus assembly protein CpaB [Pirellulaceae bacterium]
MKSISPATVTFGVMAIVLGLVAAYVVRKSLEKPPVATAPLPPAPPVEKPDLVPVAFAKNNLAKNSRIAAADIFIGVVPRGSKAATGTFQNMGLPEGRITKLAIRAGQAFRDEHLLGIGESLPDLAQRLPAGHRAVTIQLKGADTGGRRLDAGDRIDVSLTVEGTHPDLGEVMTRTLLRNVLVMDAEGSKPLARRGNKSLQSAESTVTLSVLPADANRLIVAERTGTLAAALVSLQDVESATLVPSEDVITRRELLGLKEVPAPKRFTVEKWSGGSVRLIEMSGDRVRESRDVSAASHELPVSVPAFSPDAASAIPSSAIPSGAILPAAASANEG